MESSGEFDAGIGCPPFQIVETAAGRRPELQNSEGQRLQLWAQTPPEAACRRVAVSLLRVKGLCAPSAGWGAQILRSKFSGLIPSW